MNKFRRKEINKVIEDLRAAHSALEDIKGEEEEYLENMPENLQDSERAYQAQEAIDNLEYALENIDEAMTNAEASIEN